MSTIYKEQFWDHYAMPFLGVMPSKMLELNKAVANLACGEVCDFGSGAAKIAPFILDNSNVLSYTGIDASSDMVKLARWHLEQFPEKPSKMVKGNLEQSHSEVHAFDFGLSINSYYAWNAHEVILERIRAALKPGSTFVLVTPNHQLDMAALLAEARKELVANPYFEAFSQQNMEIAANDQAALIEMDQLIDQVHKVGFKVIESNQHFYEGGLNFLQLTT